MEPEEDLLDVLQNIEFSIITEYRADRTILDIDVHDAIHALARHYEAEEEQRTPPRPRLAERAQRVFEAVQKACEWRLGRGTAGPDPPNTLTEIVACLKRIRNSIELWTKEYGRQGYLNYVQEFIK